VTIRKVSRRFDEPVTQEGMDQAIAKGRERTPTGASTGFRARAVHYVPALKVLLFSLSDRSAVGLPVGNYPEVAALNDKELKSLSLGFSGSALCLDTHDLHISLAGMVASSQPLMDMAATLVATEKNAVPPNLPLRVHTVANEYKGERSKSLSAALPA
jgi:hypothetical protein